MPKYKITNKISKRTLLIIGCLWILISCFVVRYTYAKYITSVEGNTSVDISSWTIYLNNQNITSNSDFSQNLTLRFPADTYHITNAIVPGAIRIF